MTQQKCRKAKNLYFPKKYRKETDKQKDERNRNKPTDERDRKTK